MAAAGAPNDRREFPAGIRPTPGIPGASDTSPTLTPTALNDGTLEPWGSAETDTDTYFYLTHPTALPRRVSVVLFSPGGLAHLRDVSVVAGWEQAGEIAGWTIVPARLDNVSPFEDRVTVPALPDQTIVDIHLLPGVLDEDRFNTVGLACLSTSRGDKRNWVTEGHGVYVRQLMFDRIEVAASPVGVSPDELWGLLGITGPERRYLEKNRLLDSYQLGDMAVGCLDCGDVLQRIAHHLYSYGDPEMSAALYLRAMEFSPRRDWHSNYLQALYASPGTDNARMFAACAGYCSRYFQNHATLTGRLPNRPDPERRLRVGFLGFYFDYPIARAHLLPFLQALDRERCEVFVYDDGVAGDSEAVSACADAVRDTRSLSDRELAETLRADAVDVAVELIGHLPNNRFGALAFRPTPVQACYYNWQATTGLPFIDCVFTDRDVVPAAHERYYSETALHPRHLLGGYAVPEDAPAVSPPPLLKNGYVTVGSFCSSHKLNDTSFDIWAELLTRRPSWRLVLKNASLDDPAYRRRVVTRFAGAGIRAERLTLRGHSDFTAMLDEYRELDIALGPWPFGGGSTMLWALCQGVPVVSIKGDRYVARTGAALLSQLGLDDLIASGPADYIRRTEALGANRDRLCQLRAVLRHRYQTAFPDVATFAGDWERAVRSAWHAWCASPRV